MQYRDRSSQRASERLIEPLRLVHTGSRAGIWWRGTSSARTGVRSGWTACRRSTTPGPSSRPARSRATWRTTWPSRSPNLSRATVRLRLPGSVAEQAARVPPWCGILEAGDDRHCLLELGAESVDALLALMALIGPDFEIVDDRGLLPELRAASSRLGDALVAA